MGMLASAAWRATRLVVGYLDIARLRRLAEQKLGALRSAHLPRSGARGRHQPLRLLDARIEAWIDEEAWLLPDEAWRARRCRMLVALRRICSAGWMSRRTASIVACVVAACALAACGDDAAGSGGASSTSAGGGDTSSATSTTASTTTATGDGGASGTGGDDSSTVSVGTGPSPDERRVFVTSEVFPGDFGGVEVGDAACQRLADDGDLGGAWKAWLSDGVLEGPMDRLENATVPYVLVGGDRIAQDWDDLVDFSVEVPVDHDERGRQVPDALGWTGSTPFGTCCPPSCEGFTSVEGTGMAGTTARTDNWAAGTLPECAESHHLFCIEQP